MGPGGCDHGDDGATIRISSDVGEHPDLHPAGRYRAAPARDRRPLIGGFLPVSAAGLVAVPELADGPAEVAAEALPVLRRRLRLRRLVRIARQARRADPFHGCYKETHVRAHRVFADPLSGCARE